MKIIESVSELKTFLKTKENIGFVPTMGALHDGHLSLIKRSKQECEITVVSIFVNPTQFLPGEDLSKYPRTFESDKERCEKERVDVIFFPNITELYFEDELKVIAPKKRGFILEGERRPGHFDGVLTVVLKLLNIVKPHKAYFGKKDAQQVIMIEQMVKDLFLDVEIVPCELIRESDGLAMSSRNVYLTKEQREESLKIFKSLDLAKMLITQDGEMKSEKIKSEMKKELSPLDIEYIEIRDRNLRSIKEIKIDNTLILVAVKLGKTRLIDNIWI